MDYCARALGHPLHGPYHDEEYGFPTDDDRVLFERLVLEIHQAGLSWELMLKKRRGYRAAFAGFAPERVAAYGGDEVERLRRDPGIVRNRRKIEATIDNARRICALRREHGTFGRWLAAHHPRGRDDWVRLFRRHFAFMGPEVVGEFLMSVGYLPGAHREDCPVYRRIAALGPPWMRAPQGTYG